MTYLNRLARDEARVQGFYFTRHTRPEDPTPRFWNPSHKLWYSFGREGGLTSSQLFTISERRITYCDTISGWWENLATFEAWARLAEEDLDGIWEILHTLNPHFDRAQLTATQALRSILPWIHSLQPPSCLSVASQTAPSPLSQPTELAEPSSGTPG